MLRGQLINLFPGDEVVYHTGHLAYDRWIDPLSEESISHETWEYRKGLDNRANAVWELYEEGVLDLFQVRDTADPQNFIYVARRLP